MHALGDWDFRFTVTTPEDIGRLTSLVIASPSAFPNQVVYAAGATFTYRELADTVDQVLGTTVERILLTAHELRAEVASHLTDTTRKCRFAIARPDGVAWPMSDTLNGERGMAMVNVATWLRRWRDFEGASVSEWEANAVPDAVAVRMARPERSVLSPKPLNGAIAALTQRYYGAWNNGSEVLFGETVSPDYTDRTPPAGRIQGPEGLVEAQRRF